MTDTNFETVRNQLIQEWRDAQAAAKIAVEAERGLRASLANMLFPEPVEGTNTYDLGGGGYSIKMDYSFSYEICKEPGKRITHEVYVDKVDALQSAVEATGPEGKLLAERLFKWKPELSASEFKKLDETQPIQALIKQLITEQLTTKPDSPQVKFVEPKGT